MPNFGRSLALPVVFSDRPGSCGKDNKLINNNLNLICDGMDIAKNLLL
jgi:hypothetical protein